MEHNRGEVRSERTEDEHSLYFFGRFRLPSSEPGARPTSVAGGKGINWTLLSVMPWPGPGYWLAGCGAAERGCGRSVLTSLPLLAVLAPSSIRRNKAAGTSPAGAT